MQVLLRRVLSCLCCALLLSACHYLTPYKLEIQQGNLITKEAFERVKLGMSKSDVRSALGTPLLQDVFHANRWDYVFSHSNKAGSFGPFGSAPEERKLTFFFADDKLTKIEGDASGLPSEASYEKK